jgi:hypothetical protein
MDKLAPIVKPALQDEAMDVWVPSQKLAAGLVGKGHSGPDRPFGRFVVEALKDGKDEPADLRE